MLTEPPRVELGQSGVGRRGLLWALAGGVLICEYLAISFAFDAQTVARRGGVWSWVGNTGALAPAAVAVATALLLFSSNRGEAPSAAGDIPRSRRLLLFLLHAALYALFLVATAFTFAVDEPPPGPPILWLVAWGALGAGSTLALLAALVGVEVMLRRALSSWVLVAVTVGVIAWAGGHLASVLWEPLASATLYSTSALLRVISDDVVVDPGRSLLALGEFGVTVAPVCSGLEGMGLITVLLSAMLFVLRRQFRFPHALLIVPLGVLTVWIGNSVRLALLMVIGAHIDENVALGGFHSKAGWVIFCAVTLGVAALARRWRFVSARPAEAELDSENPVAGYLAPLLVVTATGLLTGLISSGHDPYYGVRILPAAVALYLYRRYHERVRLASSSFVALGVGVLVGVAWVVTEEPTTPVPLSTVSSVWLVFRVIGFVGVAAICEELAFRGYLLRRLIASDFSAVSFRAWTPLAVIGSSFLFGALHERWLAASLAGVAYAFVQIRSGRNADAVIAHAATNGVIAARSLAVGNVAGWG